MKLIIHIDGSSLGNPGPAGAGAVIQDEKGEIIKKISQPLGKTTNNAAEYLACLLGLWEAQKLGAKKIHIFSDSELLVRQVTGIYKVNEENLKILHLLAKLFSSSFEHFAISHVSREKNKLADKLALAAAGKN